MTDRQPGTVESGPMVWLNGSLYSADAARIDPSDRGFTLGDGLFETIAVAGGIGQRLSAHFARLRQGADLLGLAVPINDDGLAEAVAQVTAANGLNAAAVRLTLTAGAGPRGLLRPEDLRPTLLLTAAELPTHALAPVRLVISRLYRRDERSPLSRVKSLGYLPSILARREAAMRGADDAVLLNTAGRVAEATAASLFLRLGDRWVTPAIDEGALPGTMRAVLLRERDAAEMPVTLAQLAQADDIVLSTALGLRTGVLVDR